MDVGGLLHGRRRGWGKTEVERKTEGTTNSGDTVNDVGTVDGAAVPGIGSGVSSFDKDCIGATIIGGDCHSFVEEAVEVLHANSFVVSACSNVNVDV